ncbi:MAG TPA: hypothetical protein VFG04_11120 [Planctomycetaceae bacterium]|jgi:hypothetical protein|nr:hypothetical protein [Planctomycetaceae bacterium]
MDVRDVWRWGAVVIVCSALGGNAGVLCADNVKLDGGGSLNGSVTTGTRAVSVRTASGAVLVFDRTAVKQVTHGHGVAAKTVSNSPNANAKSRSKKRKLTLVEEAWGPKVRSLISRLAGGDRAKSQQAHTTLLNIDETDAIPALSSYLGSSGNEEARHLYVAILHNMKGPKPVYYLVALSLFDRSPEIRSQARGAIREDQLDSARLLYIEALRSGPPRLARIAAIGLGEIGDPRGESVPYLINALVSYGTVATMNRAPQFGTLYSVTVYSTPGLNLNNSSFASAGQAPASIDSTSPRTSSGDEASKKTATTNQSSGSEATANDPVGSGGQGGQNTTPGSNATPKLQASSTSASAQGNHSMPAPIQDTYEQPIVAKKCGNPDRPLYGEIDHPEVLDALLKITDQPHPGYGFNRDRWRSWWANEQANRDLQRPAKPDRVASSVGVPR